MNAAIRQAVDAVENRMQALERQLHRADGVSCANVASLQAVLERMVNLSAELAALTARRELLLAYAELLETTPAKSGHARAGWDFAEGPAPESFPDPQHYDAARVDAAVCAALQRLPADVFATLSLSNSVAYLPLLEAGLSEQAPAGFVACAVENLRMRLEQQARIS